MLVARQRQDTLSTHSEHSPLKIHNVFRQTKSGGAAATRNDLIRSTICIECQYILLCQYTSAVATLATLFCRDKRTGRVSVFGAPQMQSPQSATRI